MDAMATWTDVARATKGLPAIVSPPGRREWRVKDKLLAWERPLRDSDRKALGAGAPTGPILAVHVPLEVKEMLLASRPEVYFTTPHFDGYPAILIRLPAVPAAELRELLHQAWVERAPKKLVAERTAPRQAKAAFVGVSDHAGWAVLMTVAPDGRVIDRRRVTLVDDGLPIMPHHHDALRLPVAEGVALVERVARSAERRARAVLASLAKDVAVPIRGIALRACPALPPTIAERLASYRAQNVADWVMYREALAAAARTRTWTVTWYDAKRVLGEAARTLGTRSVTGLLRATGTSLGPPWQQDHKLAMAAAIAASGERRR